MEKSPKNHLMNQDMNVYFKNFRKNVLVVGKALKPRKFYPEIYDKRNKLKRGGRT